MKLLDVVLREVFAFESETGLDPEWVVINEEQYREFRAEAKWCHPEKPAIGGILLRVGEGRTPRAEHCRVFRWDEGFEVRELSQGVLGLFATHDGVIWRHMYVGTHSCNLYLFRVQKGIQWWRIPRPDGHMDFDISRWIR